MAEQIVIDTEFIKLDSLLKLANLVMSGGEAKLLIQNGSIRINDQVETRRGRKLYPGDRIQIPGHALLTVIGPEQDYSGKGR